MKPLATNRTFALFVSAILLSADPASAQPENLPTRAFQRFGATKLRHGSRILCLAYVQDGQVLAAGGGNDPVRLWNPKTGELIREINEPWVQSMIVSPSGETLLFGGYHRVVRLWNFGQAKESGRLEGHKAAIKAIAVAPDASLIATASQDGAIYLWDMNTKSKVGELVGHSDEVNALVYYADADNKGFLASASSDRSIIIWNPEDEKAKVKRKIDAGCGVLALAVSADGKLLYSGGNDSFIRRWNVATGKQTGIFKGHEGNIVSLIVRGDMLISGSLDKTIRFWDTKTTNQLRALPVSQGDCDALALNKAGDFLATAGLNNTIRIFETANFKEAIPAAGIQSGLVALSLSPDNQRLATASADGQILVWDPQAGKLVRQWDSTQPGDIVLAYSPDGKTMASASDVIRFWEASQPPAAHAARLASPAIALGYSPDGKTLAAGMINGQIDLWNVEQKKIVSTLNYGPLLHAIAWSPDGKKLAAAGGAKIHVWNTQTKELAKSFDYKEGRLSPAAPAIRSLAFAPDNKTLAGGGFDGVIRIYNLNAKNPTDVLEQRLCEGHLSAVNALAFSPDGRSLVTGSFDKTVRLWEAFSGKQIALFNGHIGEVTGVAFAKDGRSAFSAGTDTVAFHWDVPGLTGLGKNGKLPELTLPPQQVEEAWTLLLSEDTGVGHKIMWECIASARQAIPVLTKKMEPQLIDLDKVKKLFRELDSPHYPTRLAAMNELPKYGRWMEGRFDIAMVNPSSLEFKRRAEMLKEKLNAINSPSLAQERARLRRFMLMCEQAGGADAIAALQLLAKRGPEEDIREEAQGSLLRMTR